MRPQELLFPPTCFYTEWVTSSSTGFKLTPALYFQRHRTHTVCKYTVLW